MLRRIADWITRGLAWTALRVFFRRVEVAGRDRLPAEGPWIFVANHPNGLIDPFLVLGFLPGNPRFLAKHTLWNNPFLKPLLLLASAIPVYRKIDGADTAQNTSMFSRCHAELARGSCVALFPEGLSHHEPSLQQLKTGAARIALEAVTEHGVANLRVVPVGLTFEDKARFRSRVLLNVGEPIDPREWAEAYAKDPREAVQELTAAIHGRIREVTLNFASWGDARLAERTVEVITRDAADMPGRIELAEHFPMQKVVGASYDALKEARPQQVNAIAAQVEHYDDQLKRLGLRDDHVAAGYPWRRVLLYLGDRVPVLALWLPVAVVGTLLNWVPYRVPGLVGERFGTSPQMPASIKLLTAFFLLPLVWGAEALFAWSYLGPWMGLLVGVGAPLSGYLALLFHERHESFWSEVRAYTVLRLRSQKARELRTLRRNIQTSIAALLEENDVVSG
ncbi:MAG: lysophospholipid acyltransferase family protein [Proteobacteria bacterium]|nr:lysophospholipid acyltransferase family protein [Pseudomonadota bacterium]